LKRRKLTKYFEKKNKDGTIIMNDLNWNEKKREAT
jgi:hypothetical protein